jgi:serine phosphatase RsbU (regulator of sigma subunit)
MIAAGTTRSVGPTVSDEPPRDELSVLSGQRARGPAQRSRHRCRSGHESLRAVTRGIGQLHLLHEHARRLRAPLDGNAVLASALAEAVAQTGAAGALFIPLGTVQPEPVTSSGAVPFELVAELFAHFQRGEGPLAAVLASGQPVHCFARGGTPLLLVRAEYGGLGCGLLGLLGPSRGRAFTAGQARLLHTLGTHLAGAMQAVQLRRELERAQHLERELELARDVQQALLPAGGPTIADLDIVASCQPAEHIGGDYFDFFAPDDSQLGLVIADVAGHGVGAAIVMAGFRAMLHGECRSDFTPAEVLTRLNRRLADDLGDSGMFVSAVLVRYDVATSVLCYANAGHPPPLVLGADQGVAGRLEAGGPVLGLSPGATFEQGVTRLDSGSVLLLYTDGLTETRGADGAPLQEEGLVRLACGAGSRRPRDLHAHILAQVSGHRAGAPGHDDLTLIVAARR